MYYTFYSQVVDFFLFTLFRTKCDQADGDVFCNMWA